MSKEMLINVVEGEECRIAVLADSVLQELYMERASSESHVGNIYKGRVTNVEPSIQAAFVDYGAPKNGFLHISDIQPKYFPSGQRGMEAVGKKRSRRDRPPIQECLRRGQEVIVQITKEGIGTKGPTLTTYLSIPGRFLVMMPGMSHHGVSRKIEDDDQRHKMRTILEELAPPADMGFIVRTAGMDRPKKDLQVDLNYLLRLWRSVAKRMQTAKAPAELYQESDLVTRTIRDIYSSEISQIVCDNEKVATKVVEFLNVVMPRGKHTVKFYNGPTPLFHRYDLEREIEKIYSRRVELQGGSSLVIDQTEALVAIDVNSGRYRQGSDAEDTAFRTNCTAGREIARQLRLRDMGGVIVIDFIDMREERHRREVESILRESVKNDRARMKILKISRFGLIEMTRQRVRPSLKNSIYRECPFCKASGLIKSDESLALDVVRSLQLACANDTIAAIEMTVAPGVAEYLNNRRRRQIAALENENEKVISVKGDSTLAGDDVVFHCTDARGSIVTWDAAAVGRTAKMTGESVTDISAPVTAESLEEDLTDVESSLAEVPASGEDEFRRHEDMLDFDEVESTGDMESDAESELAAQVEAAALARAEAMEESGVGDESTEPGEPGEPGAAAGEGSRRKRRRRGGRKHRRRQGAEMGGELAEQPHAPAGDHGVSAPAGAVSSSLSDRGTPRATAPEAGMAEEADRAEQQADRFDEEDASPAVIADTAKTRPEVAPRPGGRHPRGGNRPPKAQAPPRRQPVEAEQAQGGDERKPRRRRRRRGGRRHQGAEGTVAAIGDESASAAPQAGESVFVPEAPVPVAPPPATVVAEPQPRVAEPEPQAAPAAQEPRAETKAEGPKAKPKRTRAPRKPAAPRPRQPRRKKAAPSTESAPADSTPPAEQE